MIACIKYENLLDKDGNQKYDNMEEAKEEADFMVKKFKKMNYVVKLCINPTRVELNKLFKDIQNMIEKEFIKTNKRILLHFYYTGHGMMKELTYAVLNEPTLTKALFPIERNIRTLSSYKNTAVYLLLDCCR